MGTESLTMPPIPDLAVVAEVIRRADAVTAECRRPPSEDDRGDPGEEIDPLLRPSPARDELVAYLRRLQESDDGETVARLYGLYKAGDLACTTREEAVERYRESYDLAVQPIHRPFGTTDLAAKAPLADGLRRGLEQFGLRLDVVPAAASYDIPPTTH